MVRIFYIHLSNNIYTLVHDIIAAIKHLLYIYDYQIVVADPRTGYKYFLYTRPFNRLAERVDGVDGSKCMSELKLKCAIVGIDFDKQVDKTDLKRGIIDRQLKLELLREVLL